MDTIKKIADTSTQDRFIGNERKVKKGFAFWLVVIIVLFGSIVIAQSILRAFSSDLIVKKSSIRTAVVQRGEFVRDIIAQARIVAANSPTLFSPEQGYVELLVKAGDVVSLGQSLATISSHPLHELLARENINLIKMQTDVQRARINSKQINQTLTQAVALARVDLEEMRRKKEQAEKANALQVITPLDYKKAVDDLERARLVFQQAKQNRALGAESLDFEVQSSQLHLENQELLVEALQRRIEMLQIKSPVVGVVGSLEVAQGQAVTASQPLMTVVDLTDFEVEAVVPEGLVDELSILMAAEILINGIKYSGQITAISPEVKDGGVVARIRFSDKLPPNLRQNQRLTVQILLEKKSDVLFVDKGTFFERFRGHVYRLKDGKAEPISVVLGSASLRHVEILEGIDEGDVIIISNIVVENPDQQIYLTN